MSSDLLLAKLNEGFHSMSGGSHRTAAPPHISGDSISDRVGYQSCHNASQAGRRAAATVLKETSGLAAFCRKHNPVIKRTIKVHICRTMNSSKLSWTTESTRNTATATSHIAAESYCAFSCCISNTRRVLSAH